ncbi:hypothetical protein [Pseudarthrobacter sp. N5]|uniref:hypothetical protein n=1 Tax=Pseudarthrobacter sp. N5 TaxID=3418416 RepID=UPI003CEEFF3F
MPTVRMARVRVPPCPSPRVPQKRGPATAVVLSVALAAAAVLTGCEYSYDDGRAPLADTAVSSAAPFTDAALPQDPHQNDPVTGADLEAWVRQALPETEGQAFGVSYGSLGSNGNRTETTGQLPSGNYALTLTCRSQQRVNFTVSDNDVALIDLSIRCGTARVNVVHVSADALLSVRLDSQSAANYAYRISRI